MNNPNPFLPKGSLLELQSNRRSRLKLAVGCVLVVSVVGLVAMLIQGCKRSSPEPDLAPLPTTETNSFAAETNFPPMDASNAPATLPPVTASNPPPSVAMPLPPVDPVPPVVPTASATGSEYVVAKGDSLAKIAKNHGVTLKALETANPSVQPTKLKVGQKLTIPAGGKSAVESAAPLAAMAVGGENTGNTYTVKSGDTLIKIAKAHGVTVKAIEAANGLTTTKISVGKKLKIPAKAEKNTTAPAAPTPTVEPAVPPALPPMPAPAAAPTTPTNH